MISSRKQENKKDFAFATKSLLAGGLAGITAKTAVAPLDRVKILFQTSHPSYTQYQGSFKGLFLALQNTYRQGGIIGGFYRGHSATILRIFPYAGIKFMSYELFRGHFGAFIGGSLAGVIAVVSTYPIEVIRVLMAYETRSNTLNKPIRMRDIIRQRGLNGMYSGVVPSLIGMVPYAGVSFFSYEKIKKILGISSGDHPKTNQSSIESTGGNSKEDENTKKPIGHLATLFAGGISGVMGQTVSYPFEVIRRRMQVRNIQSQQIGMIETAQEVVKTRGVKGLFVGLGIGYLKIVPMFAISFYTYEISKRALGI